VWSVLLALVVVAFAACGSDDSPAAGPISPSSQATAETGSPSADSDQRFPDVVEVEVTAAGDGAFEVAATLSSPYDTPERYADAWRVLDPEGNEIGLLEVTHDHAAEQPFTRALTLAIPDDVDEITVEGRDLANGYGGDTKSATIPHETS
jgi:hypothetical protein